METLWGSVGEASDFSSGHDLTVQGSSPMSGSSLTVEPTSPSPTVREYIKKSMCLYSVNPCSERDLPSLY